MPPHRQEPNVAADRGYTPDADRNAYLGQAFEGIYAWERAIELIDIILENGITDERPVQVEPKDAPILVASVGNVAAAEDKVVTPSIRSVVRNICAAEKVLSLILLQFDCGEP